MWNAEKTYTAVYNREIDVYNTMRVSSSPMWVYISLPTPSASI